MRLHVRPPALENNKKYLGDYPFTKAIISFPIDKAISRTF